MACRISWNRGARSTHEGNHHSLFPFRMGSGINETSPTVSEEGGSQMQCKGCLASRTAMIVFVGALTLLGAAPGSAGTLEAVKARGVLIVGVREDFPPLAYLDGTGKPTGFEVDL